METKMLWKHKNKKRDENITINPSSSIYCQKISPVIAYNVWGKQNVFPNVTFDNANIKF